VVVRRALVAGLALGLMTTMGCTVTVNEDSKDPKSATPKAPTNADGVEQWDLRSRPTAEDVGMTNDKDVVFFETGPGDPRPVVVLLPQQRTLRVEKVSLVTFDRIGPSPGMKDTPDPTAMDFRSGPLPLDEAYALMRKSLTSFGMSTRPVDDWRAKIDNRPSSGPESQMRIEGGGNTDIGYLDIGVGGVQNPINENDTAVINFHVNFVKW